MANYLYETYLQEVMVIVFIILDWIYVLMNTTTMIPWQACLIVRCACRESCVHHLFYEYNDHDSLQPTMFSLLHISRDARLTAFFSTLKSRKENKQKKKIDVSLNFQKRDSQDVTIFHFQNLHCKSYPPQHVMESRAFFMFKLQ